MSTRELLLSTFAYVQKESASSNVSISDNHTKENLNIDTKRANTEC